MHRRNRYLCERPDFIQLSLQYPALQPYLKDGKLTRDEEAIRCLSKALLDLHFGLDVELPSGYLCPTIANRLDYIHLIEDLLLDSGIDFLRKPVRGLDIGTGTSAIYPLLGCSQHDNWKFIATEIDPMACQVAQNNVWRNKLDDRIQVKLVASENDPLFLNFVDKAQTSTIQFDFCLCNPPFYSSSDDIQQRKQTKVQPSSITFDYTESESINLKGGEMAFIERIIDESFQVPYQFRWFTTLVGIKSDLKSLQSVLISRKVKRVKILPSQVGMTKRWILAWSFFSPKRPAFLPIAEVSLGEQVDMEQVIEYLMKDLKFQKINSNMTFRAKNITWTRQARRGTSPQTTPFPMQISLYPSGRVVLIHLDEDDEGGDSKLWDNFVAFSNHLRHQFSSKKDKNE